MEKHYSYTEIAEKLNVPISTLYLYKKEGTGPHTVRVGRHFRVSESDLNVWLATNRD
jgi:excisionase family DNA binding protein